MKASQIAVVALGAAVMVAFLAYPAFATTASTNNNPATSSGSPAAATSSTAAPQMGGPMHRIAAFFGGRGGLFGGHSAATNFTTGQTITLTSTNGNYFVVGSQGLTNGTASGTLTFTVTGKLTAGYILNVGGSLTVAGTTYNVTSGSAVMGPGGSGIQGEGATSPSGSYIVRATAHGDFSGTTTSRVSLDFSSGTTEYAVVLSGTITG